MHDNYPLALITVAAIAATAVLPLSPSIANPSSKSKSYPTTGKVVNLTNGDLMCYVDLIDERGKKQMLGADFEICQQTRLLTKRVRLTYQRRNVNDCQSASPCGKTRVENLIVKMRSISKK